MSKAREEILRNLKEAVFPVPEAPVSDDSVYHAITEPLDLAFKASLEKVNGHVYLHNSSSELDQSLVKFLSGFQPGTVYCGEESLLARLQEHGNLVETGLSDRTEVGITSCEYLIAHTGSVMVSSRLEGGRKSYTFPPIHVVISTRKNLVGFLDEAYQKIRERYPEEIPSQISLITGPSRTADIEKTLVMGAHGPKELHVFIA